MTERETAVDRLHAVPLEDFVAERKRLAKELRDAGDREAATELSKLPKPSAPAWALNHLARDEPEAVRAWLEAAERLRAASGNPREAGRDALRAAIAAHREATRQLLAAVRDGVRPNGRKLSEPMLDRVRDLLQVATVDPDEADLLRAGRIVEGDADAEPDVAESADEGRAATRRGAAPRGEKEREAREREAEERADLERLVAAAEERVAELSGTLDEREQAAAAALEQLEQAQRTLHRSESEAAAARDAVAEARDAAADAERELETLSAKLRKAGSS